MLSFSDFILSQSPWTYCRLDEPIGYSLYHDITGNKNHLFSSFENDTYSEVASNRQVVTLLGDPFIGGLRPLIENQVIRLNSIDHSIPLTSLWFRVPEFKSDTITFRRRVKVQNSLDVREMWIDFLMDPHITSYHSALEPYLPSLMSGNGSALSIDNLYLSGEFGHIDGLGGSRTETIVNGDVQLYTMNETFLVFGCLTLVGITGVHYSSSGDYLGHTLRLALVARYRDGGIEHDYTIWSKTLLTIDTLNDPVTVFSDGLHRFTFGILNPTDSSLTVKVSVDGGAAQVIEVDLPEGLTFDTFNHSVYSRVAILNDTVFSNIAVFYHTPYPSTDWLSSSQKALLRSYLPPISEDYTPLANLPMIEKEPGSLLNVLNSALLLGTDQTSVSGILRVSGLLSARVEPALPGLSVGGTVKIGGNKQGPFDGCWRVIDLNSTNQITVIPVTNTRVPTSIELGLTEADGFYRFSDETMVIKITTVKPHSFSIGDSLTLHQITDQTQPHSWVVGDIDAEGFTATLSGVSLSYTYSSDALVKRTPIGGGCWKKVFTTNLVGWQYESIEAYQKNILLDDRVPHYSKVYLAETDNSSPSEGLFIPKDIKNSFNKERTRFPSKAFGDCHRLYLFLPAKQNTVSHTSVITMGEIHDWFNDEWCVVAVVSASNHRDQDIGYNYAFFYPDWIIDRDTGYLVCRSFKSHASDSRIKTTESLIGFGDSGQHVYPINVPYTSFVPI